MRSSTFREAIRDGDLDTIKNLITLDEKSINGSIRENGDTPLIYALKLKQWKIVEYLLNLKSIEINIENLDMDTALTMACCHARDRSDLSKFILAKSNTQTLNKRNNFNISTLRYAMGYNEFLAELILARPDLDQCHINDSYVNKFGISLPHLEYALFHRKPKIALLLLKRGSHLPFLDTLDRIAYSQTENGETLNIIYLLQDFIKNKFYDLNRLGDCYIRLLNDIEEAKYYYKLAADNQNPYAMWQLASLERTNSENLSETFYWLKKSFSLLTDSETKQSVINKILEICVFKDDTIEDTKIKLEANLMAVEVLIAEYKKNLSAIEKKLIIFIERIAALMKKLDKASPQHTPHYPNDLMPLISSYNQIIKNKDNDYERAIFFSKILKDENEATKLFQAAAALKNILSMALEDEKITLTDKEKYIAALKQNQFLNDDETLSQKVIILEDAMHTEELNNKIATLAQQIDNLIPMFKLCKDNKMLKSGIDQWIENVVAKRKLKNKSSLRAPLFEDLMQLAHPLATYAIEQIELVLNSNWFQSQSLEDCLLLHEFYTHKLKFLDAEDTQLLSINLANLSNQILMRDNDKRYKTYALKSLDALATNPALSESSRMLSCVVAQREHSLDIFQDKKNSTKSNKLKLAAMAKQNNLPAMFYLAKSHHQNKIFGYLMPKILETLVLYMQITLLINLNPERAKKHWIMTDNLLDEMKTQANAFILKYKHSSSYHVHVLAESVDMLLLKLKQIKNNNVIEKIYSTQSNLIILIIEFLKKSQINSQIAKQFFLGIKSALYLTEAEIEILELQVETKKHLISNTTQIDEVETGCQSSSTANIMQKTATSEVHDEKTHLPIPSAPILESNQIEGVPSEMPIPSAPPLEILPQEIEGVPSSPTYNNCQSSQHNLFSYTPLNEQTIVASAPVIYVPKTTSLDTKSLTSPSAEILLKAQKEEALAKAILELPVPQLASSPKCIVKSIVTETSKKLMLV